MENSKDKRGWVLKFLNIILLCINLWMILGVSVLLANREVYVEISQMFLTPKTPIMGSTVLEFFLRKEFLILTLIAALIIIVKEFKVKKVSKRLYINLYFLAGLTAHVSLLFYLIFRPILHGQAA